MTKNIVNKVLFSLFSFSIGYGFELNNSKSYNGYTLVYLRYSVNNTNNSTFNEFMFQNIDGSIDVWNIDTDPWFKNKLTIHALVNPKMKSYFLKLLRDNHMEYQIKIENIQDAILNEKQFNAKVNDLKNITFDKFYRHYEINTYLENLHIQFPKITRIINIGKSYEGRDMKVIHISSSHENKIKKPAILIEGGMHAREWIAPSQVLYIISQLVDNRKDLIEHIDWYLLPVLNPDGYEYTHTNDRLWRKTRSRIRGKNYLERCIGVDGNRNFNIGWIPLFYCTNLFSGLKPLSEIEVENFTKFAKTIKHQIKLYLSFHSYGNKILIPYGYTFRKPTNFNELTNLGKAVNDSMPENYDVGSSFTTIYYVPGGSVDWFYEELNVSLSYCLELTSSSFIVNETDILNVVSGVFKGVDTFAKYVQKNYYLLKS